MGYSEVFKYFDGELSLETAIELIKRNTRLYAKRQMTWFRKEKEIFWIGSNAAPEMRDVFILLQYLIDKIWFHCVSKTHRAMCMLNTLKFFHFFSVIKN